MSLPFTGADVDNTEYVSAGAEWKYLDDGSDQGTDWVAPGFNDAAWASGNAQLGYGDGDETTVVGFGPDENDKYITTYFRRTFQVADITDVIKLRLMLLRDDGAVVYINGTEAARSSMADGEVAYTTVANDAGDENKYYEYNLDSALLVDGTNTIAVEVHQSGGTSSDMSFDLVLYGVESRVDGAVPAAPSALADTDVTTSTIDLGWTDNATDEVGYELWRKVGDGSWAIYEPVLSPDTNAYGDSMLSEGTQYTYKVRAYSQNGLSAFSDELVVTTLAASTPLVWGEDFDSGSFGQFTTVSVTSNADWEPSEYPAGSGEWFARINGYGADTASDDWLISPAFSLKGYRNEYVQADLAYNYDGPELEVLVSDNYDADVHANPADAHWTALPAAMPSVGSYTFETTGELGLDLASSNFDDSTFGTFVNYSVASNADWVVEERGGKLGAVANGFGADGPSDDWLISPAMAVGAGAEFEIAFNLYRKYDGPALQVMVSEDYSGTGDPTAATWTSYTVSHDDIDDAWKPVSVYYTAGQNGPMYVAFRYVSTGTGSGDGARLGVDDVVVQPTTVNVAFHYVSTGTGGGDGRVWEVDNFEFRGDRVTFGSEDFNGDIISDTSYTSISAASTADWVIEERGGQKGAIANGYGADGASDDWLVSPAVVLPAGECAELVFDHYRKYDGPALQVMVSTDYDGGGDPSTANWDAYEIAHDDIDDSWATRTVDLCGYSGTVYVAFRYTSTGTGSGDGARIGVDNAMIVRKTVEGLNVDFTANSTTVTTGVSVAFTSYVSGGPEPHTYSWEFGDGGTSTDTSPSYAYSTAGTYSVTLCATDADGVQVCAAKGEYITVEQATAFEVAEKVGGLRVATYNCYLNRASEGEILEDLADGDNEQIRNVAEIIQRTNPDIILLNEFDYVEGGQAVDLFQQNYLSVGQNGAAPVAYDYYFVAESNTGISSGVDLDGDGSVGGPDDAYGYGEFPGQYGMALLSRFPIDTANVRTFQNFLWKDMPDNLMPTDHYSAAAQEIFRLSSKSHWDVPVDVHGVTVHLLCSHPTPPTFDDGDAADGAVDWNGRRNHDEIRFWADYVAPGQGDYIYDDNGDEGGLASDQRFVVLGDQNADPDEGDSYENAIDQLLESAMIDSTFVPESAGAVDYGIDPDDTASWGMRADYNLPSAFGLSVEQGAVFWPAHTDELYRLVENDNASSDHRLVWLDLAFVVESYEYAMYYPHIASDGDGPWETEICAINTDSENNVNGHMKAYDDAGQELEDRYITLPPNGRREMTVGEAFENPGEIRYIILLTDASTVCGYQKFEAEGKYRAAVPAAMKASDGDIYVAHIDSNANWATGIGLLNTTSADKTITFEFDDGSSVERTIAANAHQSFTIRQMFDGAYQPGIGAATIKNGAGIVGLELIVSMTNSGMNYLSGLALSDETASEIYFPHNVNDETWNTQIGIYNPSDSDADLTVTPYRTDGTALDPVNMTVEANGKLFGVTSDMNLPAGTAWFAVESSAPVASFQFLVDKDGNQMGGYNGEGIAATQGVFAKTGGIDSAIAFVNIEDAAANVVLTAYDNSGNTVATQELVVNPYAKAVGAPAELFTSDIEAASYIGYESDMQIAGCQLNVEENIMLDVLPTMDGDLDLADQGPTLVFPTKEVLDNIEEYVADGSWDAGSSDLEIGYEKPDEPDQLRQIVGVRFQNVTIPAGVAIVKAYIQFTQDEDKNASPFAATIWGEAAGDASQFKEEQFAVSSRTKTAASVSWTDVAEWTTEHEAGKDQQTPDLMPVIEEITSRSDWSDGNAMVFIIEATGTRTAESFDGGGEEFAPKLVFEIPTTAEYQPQASDDDAEEGDDGAGVLDIESSDLEIVQDHEDEPDRNQTVGIRFRNVSIPQGAEIVSAFIQFDVDEEDKNADPFNVTVTGEANSYPEAFFAAEYNISSRARTSASVAWADIPAWTVEHERGPDQQTPDLAAIVQEIVDRDDWYGGNNMVFILEGTGQRTAESFDGAGDDAEQRPTLVVSFVGEEESPTVDKVRASWNDDTSTTMVIGWDQLDGDNPVIKWDTESHGRNASAYPNTLAPYKSNTALDMNTHFAKFTGLSPDTMVYFVIQDDKSVSKPYSFLTAPDTPQPFSYVSGGDTKSSGDPYSAGQFSNKMIAKLRPLFVLFTGDYCSGDGTDADAWKDWLTNWSEQTTTDDGRLIPHVAVHGNHENGDYEVLYKLFDTPVTNNDPYSYYSLGFGGGLLKVIALNSELQNGDAWADAFLRQNLWLADELAASQDCEFLVAGYHKPLRPHTASKPEQLVLIESWADMFYEYGLDVACESDSHMHKYTFPLAPCDDDTDPDCFQSFKQDDEFGVFYQGEGSWGATPRRHDDDKPWTIGSDSYNQFKWTHVHPASGNDVAYLDVRTVVTGLRNCYYDECPEGVEESATMSQVDDVEALTEENKYTRIPDNIVLGDTPYFGEVIKVPFGLNAYEGEAPAAPENLAGEAISYTEITLTWENTSEEPVQKIELERKVGDGDWEILNSQILPTIETYTLNALQDGVDYTFRMRSRNIFGYSDYTGELVVSTPADPRLKVVFQQGLDDYEGTVDLELRDASPDDVFDGTESVSVDMEDGGVVHGMIRFKEVISAIPEGAQIASAELQVLTTSDSDGEQSFYRMLQDWPEACTWNTLGGDGVTPDGVEATKEAEASIDQPGSGELAFIDVTTSVAAWMNGAPNYGWGIVNSSTDGWDFYSSEHDVMEQRPKLTVYYTMP